MGDFADSYSIDLRPWGLWACVHRLHIGQEFDEFCSVLGHAGIRSRQMLGTHCMFLDISAIGNALLTFDQINCVMHTMHQIGCKRGTILVSNWRTAAVATEAWQGYGFADSWRALPANPVALKGVNAGYDWILRGKEPRLVVPSYIDDPDLRQWVEGLYDLPP